MGSKPAAPETDELFLSRLEKLHMCHPLVRLTGLSDLGEIERIFRAQFGSGGDQPSLPRRLVAGLLYLQHAFGASDEAVVNTCVENLYWQYFSGEVYLQTEAPIAPSSLTRWMKRIGEEGAETLLMTTIEAARRRGVVKASSVDRLFVDTTVMRKAIAHLTDSRLLENRREHLAKVAEKHGICSAPDYNRMAPGWPRRSDATPAPSSSSG